MECVNFSGFKGPEGSITAEDIENLVDGERLSKVLRQEMYSLLEPREAEALGFLYEAELSPGDTAKILGLLLRQDLDGSQIEEIQESALQKLRKSEKLKAFFQEE